MGLKLSFRARMDTSELRLDLSSLGTKEKDSNDATRLRDMLKTVTERARSKNTRKPSWSLCTFGLGQKKDLKGTRIAQGKKMAGSVEPRACVRVG